MEAVPIYLELLEVARVHTNLLHKIHEAQVQQPVLRGLLLAQALLVSLLSQLL